MNIQLISILLTVLNLLLFAVSLFCMIRDWQIVDSIGTGAAMPCRTEQNDLLLELQSGQIIRLRFRQKNVTVYCAYDITQREDELRLISFIRTYAQDTDIAIPRSNSELLGELKLHSLLYNLGYGWPPTAGYLPIRTSSSPAIIHRNGSTPR